MRRVAPLLVLLGGLGALFSLGLRAWVHHEYSPRVFTSAARIPADGAGRVAIVFGAGVRGNTPSLVLYDRVAAAVDLYRAGRVDKLLLTGDNRFENYNEPAVMRRTALALGAPEEALVLDFAGRSTYDSCYRAREIFRVRRAVLVTQPFHLDRALYLCESLGIDAVGLAAAQHTFRGDLEAWWETREVLATTAAWIAVNVTGPVPLLGEQIPIQE